AIWTIILELDRTIEAENVHVPQRGANGLRLRLAGDLDRLGDGADAVIAAKARGQPSEWQSPVVPLRNKSCGRCGIRGRLRRPRGKENQMPSAVRGFTGVGDQLIGILRSAGAYDAQIEAERGGLLED